MDPRPFTEGEYRFLSELLSGDSPQLEVLRLQFDSLRFGSRFYKKGRLLGFPMRRQNLTRKADRLLFRVSWGCGSEDWQLGERRRRTLNDVVGQLRDGRYLCAELHIENGCLQELRLVGVITPPSTAITPCDGAREIDNVEVLCFSEPWDAPQGVGPSRLLSTRFPQATSLLSPPLDIINGRPFQKWLLTLDQVEVHDPDRMLPLRCRRTYPATSNEIDAFEHRHSIIIPGELREFWMTTDGASFLGDIIRGTYDAPVVKWEDSKRLLFLQSGSDDQDVILIEVSEGGSSTGYEASVFHEHIGTQETRRTWTTLRECLETLMKERTG